MSNTHGRPDVAYEAHAIWRDAFAGYVTSGGVPSPSLTLTLPPFPTTGYVADGAELVYVDQPSPAQGLPLTQGAGTYWIGLGRSLTATVAGWTRWAGTHYLTFFGTLGAPPTGVLPLARLTVSATAITAVDLQPFVTALRTGRGLALTTSVLTPPIGTALPTQLLLYVGGGVALDPPVLVVDSVEHRLGIGTPTPQYPVDVASQIRLASNVGLGMPPGPALALGITPPANANVAVQVHNFDSAGGALAYVGQVNFGTGKWNSYMSGSAGNYFAGNVAIGTTDVTTYQLRVNGSVGLDAPTLVIDAVNDRVGIGTTSPQQGLDVAPAARFQFPVGLGMLPSANLALGITPSTTTPVAVQVHDWTTPASGSIAYVGQVVFGTGKWNAYMSGTAGNYFAGNVAINSTNVSNFQLHCNGSAGKPTGGTWADSTSFAHLKQAIRPLTQALATLLTLRGRQWEWADDQPALAAQFPGTQTGLVLDEVAEDMPTWVLRDASGVPVALQERGTTALIVEAFREVMQRLEVLEAR